MTENTAVFNDKYQNMPLLALRGITAFPAFVVTFDVERVISLNALNAALDEGREIFLISQRDIDKDSPTAEDLFSIGTVCKIKQVLKMQAGVVRVTAEGLFRARLLQLFSKVDMLRGRILPIASVVTKVKDTELVALKRKAVELFGSYSKLTGNIEKETLLELFGVKDAGAAADYVALNLPTDIEDKQSILECIDVRERLEKIIQILSDEIEIASVEHEIDSKLFMRISEQQRVNILKEQMSIIKSELGYTQENDNEFEDYRLAVYNLSLSQEIEEKLLKEVDKLEKQPFGSAEASVIKSYLDLCLELPWNKKSDTLISVENTRETLDNDHYGLENVKKRILEYVAVKQFAPQSKGTILCLVGPPGTGKTSIAISIASALNRKLARVALGGVHDEAEIRGHRKTYVGAMPGRIISAINQCGYSNPVMLLDEIDKLGSDYRGDPSSALLEALDPEQNKTFRDNFLEIPFDLSDVIFITTANDPNTIPKPLYDRMEIIELSSYTDEEKLQIAKRHLLPKQRKQHGLNGNQIRISDNAIRLIISNYTRESGVRELERSIATICRKTVTKIVAGECSRVFAKPSDLQELLGVAKYERDDSVSEANVGVVCGLAWTSVGGETLEVEVNILEGTGKLECTGNLGTVMQESVKAAVSYIRSVARKFRIDPDFYKNKDIHIHFPEGAVPKDGPSAGITVTVAVLSALMNLRVRGDVAMTGEITLRGRVLPIGGLKEKTMAALRAGKKLVIIPEDNMKDLADIDPLVRKELEFLPVKNAEDILSTVLLGFNDYIGVSENESA